MRRYVVTLFSAAAMFGGHALAADVVPESTVDWTGFYLGASGVLSNVSVDYSDSYAGGHIEEKFEEPDSVDSDDFSDVGFGAQLGYLHQHGSLVFGGEIFAEWNNAEGCIRVVDDLGSDCPTGHSIETEIDSTFGANAKLGISTGPALLYGLAGVSWSSVKSTYNDWTWENGPTYEPNTDDTIDSNSDNAFGWRFGAGAEFMVTERVSVFAQGSYTSFNTSFDAKNLSEVDGSETGLDSDFGVTQVNAGVNFHF